MLISLLFELWKIYKYIIFKLNQDILNLKFLSLWIYFLIVLFDIGCCDIFTNIHATLLVFIVIIILIILTVRCCGNYFFNRIFLKMVWNLGPISRKPRKLFRSVKPLSKVLNLTITELFYSHILLCEERFPSYKKF